MSVVGETFEHDREEDILQPLAEEANLDVKAFNQHSRELQISAGVNPDECIELVEEPEISADNATPLRTYLISLVQRKYAVPTIDEGRTHDIDYHIETVRLVHPAVAEVIASHAAYGLALLDENYADETKYVADQIDVLLANPNIIPRAWQAGITEILFARTRGEMYSPEIFELAASLAKIQEDHERKMIALSRGISGVMLVQKIIS